MYDLLIHIYQFAVRIAALWNEKARLWVQGREELIGSIESELTPFGGRTIWVHCASLGEFEMARPIMEGLRSYTDRPRIVLTFFSPSGYEVRMDYAGADHVFYLPADTVRNAQRFVDAVKPDVAIFVKYDLWWNFLAAAKSRGARLLLISAIFRPGQYFFRWYGWHGRRCLSKFDRIFTVDNASCDLLRTIGIASAEACGDTRYDRVMHVAENWVPLPGLDVFKGQDRLVVCGSTWTEDEAVIAKAMAGFEGLKWAIAPHEVAESNLQRLEHLFPQAVRLSRYSGQQTDLLLVDSIGLLSRIYGHADVAYVGGGFGRTLHNVLEATAYGLPVLFGPDHATFPDAGRLVYLDLAFSIGDADHFVTTLGKVLGDDARKAAILAFMHEREGATRAILSYLA
ncbi:MAG: hypothetical protein K9J06_03035 [Flavobacteriales bacterium]|nr:hypothetical protein [Flavobacteriales bacterium]